MKQHKNFKDPFDFAQGKQKSNITNLLLGSLIFIILFFNLIYSQIISPVYFQFVNNDRNATVGFLEKIKIFPEFRKILEMNKNIYGLGVEKEVFRQENEKKLLIDNLEQKLKINPKARDVLYSLFLLFKESGNNLTAEKYLIQAREIDPSIK